MARSLVFADVQVDIPLAVFGFDSDPDCNEVGGVALVWNDMVHLDLPFVWQEVALGAQAPLDRQAFLGTKRGRRLNWLNLRALFKGNAASCFRKICRMNPSSSRISGSLILSQTSKTEKLVQCGPFLLLRSWTLSLPPTPVADMPTYTTSYPFGLMRFNKT